MTWFNQLRARTFHQAVDEADHPKIRRKVKSIQRLAKLMLLDAVDILMKQTAFHGNEIHRPDLTDETDIRRILRWIENHNGRDYERHKSAAELLYHTVLIEKNPELAKAYRTHIIGGLYHLDHLWEVHFGLSPQVRGGKNRGKKYERQRYYAYAVALQLDKEMPTVRRSRFLAVIKKELTQRGLYPPQDRTILNWLRNWDLPSQAHTSPGRPKKM